MFHSTKANKAFRMHIQFRSLIKRSNKESLATISTASTQYSLWSITMAINFQLEMPARYEPNNTTYVEHIRLIGAFVWLNSFTIRWRFMCRATNNPVWNKCINTQKLFECVIHVGPLQWREITHFSLKSRLKRFFNVLQLKLYFLKSHQHKAHSNREKDWNETYRLLEDFR